MRPRSSSAIVISTRALNRALLARQLLLERSALSPTKAIEHLVGLQAQTPASPYVALWSRLRAFDPLVVSKMLEGRRAVRLALMRATLHLVTARDALPLRAATQPAADRTLWRASPYGRRLNGIDFEKLLQIARELVDETPRSLAELREHLHERFPDFDKTALGYAAHYSLPLVQVPPRGTWGGSGRAVCTTATAWLGEASAEPMPLETLVRRYLAAFGPASPRDMQAWSGVAGLDEVFERLRPKLRTFTSETGRELFDLPGAPRPHAETPAPVRFIPDFDNLVLAHADRARVIGSDVRALFPGFGAQPGMLLVDGFVGGTWKLIREQGGAAVELHLWRREPPSTRAEIEEEGAALAAFLAPDAQRRTVRFRKTPFRSVRATARSDD